MRTQNETLKDREPTRGVHHRNLEAIKRNYKQIILLNGNQ